MSAMHGWYYRRLAKQLALPTTRDTFTKTMQRVIAKQHLDQAKCALDLLAIGRNDQVLEVSVSAC